MNCDGAAMPIRSSSICETRWREKIGTVAEAVRLRLMN
jgi:hypothetical protein